MCLGWIALTASFPHDEFRLLHLFVVVVVVVVVTVASKTQSDVRPRMFKPLCVHLLIRLSLSCI